MKRCLVLALMCSVVLSAYPAIADREITSQYLVRPSKARKEVGRTYDALFASYFHWFWTDWYDPGDLREEGLVTFIRTFQPDGGETFNDVGQGQYLAVPLANLTGESYEDGLFPDDDPKSFPPTDYLNFQIYIDGVLVLDGADPGARQYLFKVAYFDEPIEYPEPEYRFTDPVSGLDAYAVSSIWTDGTGCIVRPLPVGEHVIRVEKYFPSFDVSFTDIVNVNVMP